jgi:hypothetical protein
MDAGPALRITYSENLSDRWSWLNTVVVVVFQKKKPEAKSNAVVLAR